MYGGENAENRFGNQTVHVGVGMRENGCGVVFVTSYYQKHGERRS